MKHPFILIIFSLIFVATAAHALRLSEPVQRDAESETFGAIINKMPEEAQISELLESPEEFQNSVFSVTAEVNKVCQKKGCFFIAQQDQRLIRVAFKDYGFFVPTDIAGQVVTLVGELLSKQISPEQATHFNQDLGEGGIIESGQGYEILATSVRVPIKQ